MAIIDNRTAGRDWLLPDPTNKIKDDVVRLIAALEAADGDVTDILIALGQKAALEHTHSQAQITGLVDALAAKRNTADPYALDDLSDVDAGGAASGMALVRQGTVWTPVALGVGNIENLGATLTGLGNEIDSLETAVNAALAALDTAKAPKASPTFTGTPAAPTATFGTNTTQLATTAYVVSAIAGTSINSLADVDTAGGNAPDLGDGLIWDGTKWIPSPAGSSEPVGRIALLMGPSPDAGWLAFGEGGTYDTGVFPDLAAWMATNFPGQAAGTFPDWRDRVPRTAGGALGPALRATQEDALQSHFHNVAFEYNSGSTGTTNALSTNATSAGRTLAGGANVRAENLADGGSGAPRSATETRVKSFGVRWQIKAAGAVINPGGVDMAVISTIAGAAVRRDVDQAAQAFSDAHKINILKNTLQAWELIGAPVSVGTPVASIDWTGLSAFRELRLWLFAGSVNTDSHVSLRVGNGSFDTTANYDYEYLRAWSSSIDAGQGITTSALIHGTAPGNSATSRFLSTVTHIHEFNTAHWTRFISSGASRNAAGTFYFGNLAATLQVATPNDRFQVLGGGGLNTGTRAVLEGIRG